MVDRKEVLRQTKRSMFCFDFSVSASEILRENKEKNYPEEPSLAGLVRHVITEFNACHFSEEDLKKRALLPSYLARKPSPALLIAAIRMAIRTTTDPREIVEMLQAIIDEAKKKR